MPDRKSALAETLRRRILSMEAAPGAIVDETMLAEEFGLSRPPVRELMRQLAAEGYLELEPNRPARVTAMSLDTLRSFFLAAPMIYIATTRLAAANATAAEIGALKQVQRDFLAAIAGDDIAGRVYHNNRFHLAIGEIGHNPYLMPSLRRLLIDHSRLGMTFYRPTTDAMHRNLEAAVTQHDQIIEAIERRDAEAAGDLARAHLDLSRRRMADFAVPAGLDVPLA
jgi:DNA-binding GntR family transcriptional regulator